MAKGDKIFAESLLLFKEAQEPAAPEGEQERSIGRDPGLVAERNELIVHRYYFYTAHTDKRWPVIVKLLRREFFLSEVTLNEIIVEMGAKRRQLMREAPPIRALKEKFPLSVWDINQINMVIKQLDAGQTTGENAVK